MYEVMFRDYVLNSFSGKTTLKAFGQQQYGLFPGSTVIEQEICRQYRVQVVGRLDSVVQRFYAITAERRIKHPSVLAIIEAVRHEILT